MATKDLVIDVDDYEFKNDPIRVNAVSGATDDSLEQYHNIIGAKIIDYGICEEQDKKCENMSLLKQDISQLESPKAKTHKEPLINTSGILYCSKTKQALVKIVDFNKFPWYYTKYKNQILKRKYSNVLNHERKILNNMKEKSTEKDNNTSRINRKSANVKKDFFYVKKHMNHKEVNKSNVDVKIFSHISDQVTEKCPSPKTFNLKKNTGLIGMKIQKISIEKEKAMKKSSNKEKVKHRKTNSKKSTRSRKNDKINNKVKTNINESGCNKKRENEKDLFLHKDDTNTTMSTPKIMGEKNLTSNDILVKTDSLQDFKDKTTGKGESKDSKPINVINLTKYKPMPMSKKLELEKQSMIKIKNFLNKNKDEFIKRTNNLSKHITILKKKINIPSTHFTKKYEPTLKSFSKFNKFTGKIIKILNNPQNIDNDSVNFMDEIMAEEALNKVISNQLQNITTKKVNKLSPREIYSAKSLPDSNTKQQQNNQIQKKQSPNLQDIKQTSDIDDKQVTTTTRHPLKYQEYESDVIYPIQKQFNSDEQKKLPTTDISDTTCTVHSRKPLQSSESIVKQINTVHNKRVESSKNNNSSKISSDVPIPNHIPNKTPVITRSSASTKPHILRRSAKKPPNGSNIRQQFSDVSKCTQHLHTPPPVNTYLPILPNIRPEPCGSFQLQAPSFRYQNTDYQLTYDHPIPAYQKDTLYNDNQKSVNQSSSHGRPSCQKMPVNKFQESPGTCEVLPSNDCLGLNFYNLAFPPQNFSSSKCTSNLESSSIIGKNDTGFVKKIYISVPEPIDVEKQTLGQKIIANQENLVKCGTDMEVNNSKKVENNMPVFRSTEINQNLNKKNNKMEQLPQSAKNKLQPVISQNEQLKLTASNKSKLQNRKSPSDTVKAGLSSFTTSKISKIELTNPSLLETQPKLMNFEKSQTKESKQEKKNICKYNRPGPLSKKNKHAVVLEDVKCNGYSPPILPIPTYDSLLSEATEMIVTDVKNEETNDFYEQSITPIEKSFLHNNHKKSINLPRSPKKDDTKKISFAEYKKKYVKD